MKRDYMKVLKKYHFIILFGISFTVYMTVLGMVNLGKAAKNSNEDYLESYTTQAATDSVTIVSDTQTVAQDESVADVDGNNTDQTEETNEASEVQTTEQEPADVKPPAIQNTNTGFEFITADSSYLDGALFIGDSRTVTLSEYAGWDNTTFYVETGLTIWTVMDANVAKSGGTKTSVRNALSLEKFDKIYIMLGINELGQGTPDSFYSQYKSVIDEIKALQPQAVIYIQSIMHVTQSKDNENYYINNNEIYARNDKIKTLADGTNVFWIDENEVFNAPGTNKLNPEYTSDGVHLKPKYIGIWQEFLLNHVISR